MVHRARNLLVNSIIVTFINFFLFIATIILSIFSMRFIRKCIQTKFSLQPSDYEIGSPVT